MAKKVLTPEVARAQNKIGKALEKLLDHPRFKKAIKKRRR